MEALTPQEIQQMIEKIISPVQKTQLAERMALDLGYGVHGLSRFRGNIYVQRGTMAAAFRRIPYEVPGYGARSGGATARSSRDNSDPAS